MSIAQALEAIGHALGWPRRAWADIYPIARRLLTRGPEPDTWRDRPVCWVTDRDGVRRPWPGPEYGTSAELERLAELQARRARWKRSTS